MSALDRPRWSLIIPMYREAGRIDAAVHALATSKLAEPDIEIIFVDDGSDDATSDRVQAVCLEAGLRAELVRLPMNQGKGAAVRAGVLQARGEVVGFSDADLSCAPDDIVRVFSAVEAGDADVAIASRTDPDSALPVRQPLLRRSSGFVFNMALRALSLTKFADTQCGLKAFTQSAARELFEPLRTRRFAFDVEVLARARVARLTVKEIPVTWQHVEASRVRPFADGSRMLLDAVAIRWRLRAGRR